jgi:hypothetical protein
MGEVGRARFPTLKHFSVTSAHDSLLFPIEPRRHAREPGGHELQRLFDDKWKNLPQPIPQPSYNHDTDAEDDDSEDDKRIAEPLLPVTTTC